MKGTHLLPGFFVDIADLLRGVRHSVLDDQMWKGVLMAFVGVVVTACTPPQYRTPVQPQGWIPESLPESIHLSKWEAGYIDQLIAKQQGLDTHQKCVMWTNEVRVFGERRWPNGRKYAVKSRDMWCGADTLATLIEKHPPYVDAVLTDAAIELYISRVVRCDPANMYQKSPQSPFKIKDPSLCERGVVGNVSAQVTIAGFRRLDCTVDATGRCHIELNDSDRETLFSLKKLTGSFWIEGKRADTRFLKWTVADGFWQAQKEHRDRTRRGKINAVIQMARDIIESAKSICPHKKADPTKLKTLLFKLVRIIDALKTEDVLPAELAEQVETISAACERHAPTLARQGLEKTKELRPTEALEYFETIQHLWPDSKTAKDEVAEGIAQAKRTVDALTPERIKDIAAYPEGDGVVGYIALINKKGEYTAVPGTVSYDINIRSRGVSVDRCFQNKMKVDLADFETAIVGSGVFQREILMLELPFLKWREMTCHAVKTYLGMGGIAGLEQMKYDMDFSLRVRFQTEEGDTLESVKDFRP